MDSRPYNTRPEADRQSRKQAEDDERKDHLYRQIGQLQVELDWLKKVDRDER